MDKLPDHDFGGQVSVPPEAIATTAACASAERGVKPKVSHQENDAKDVGNGSPPPPFPPGKLNNSGCTSSAADQLRRESSRVADVTSSGDERGGELNGVGGAEDDNDGNKADHDSSNSRGGYGKSMRPVFAWVASHEGDPGPHTTVRARNAEWAVVARDVRFRLANTWLSCEQVCNNIHTRNHHKRRWSQQHQYFLHTSQESLLNPP